MSTRAVVLVALAACICLAHSTAPAIVIRDDRSDSQYRSLAASYPSVGQFIGSTSTGGGYYASGTLISPNWVLTAAHVVDSASTLTFKVGGASYTADRWLAHPSWTGNLGAGYDIGLVHLPTAVTGVTPARRYTGTSERGAVAAIVGYGTTGTGLTGGTTFDGQKRGAQNVLDVLDNPRLLLMDFDNPRNRNDSSMGSNRPQNLEGLIAPGDSGGGAFITTRSGTFLAGVHSWGGSYDGNTNFDYGDVSGHTRVSAFNSWMDGVMASSATGGGGTVVSGTGGASAVPEPATAALLAAAGLALVAWAWRRRRR
jgi:hypothetical protein